MVVSPRSSLTRSAKQGDVRLFLFWHRYEHIVSWCPRVVECDAVFVRDDTARDVGDARVFRWNGEIMRHVVSQPELADTS